MKDIKLILLLKLLEIEGWITTIWIMILHEFVELCRQSCFSLSDTALRQRTLSLVRKAETFENAYRKERLSKLNGRLSVLEVEAKKILSKK